jgi:hypothetical protein
MKQEQDGILKSALKDALEKSPLSNIDKKQLRAFLKRCLENPDYVTETPAEREYVAPAFERAKEQETGKQRSRQ